MKKAVKSVRKALSVLLMVILVLNLSCLTYCMETGSAGAADSMQKVTGNQEAVTIPEGLTSVVAAEYMEIVRDICKEYGPERLCWRDGDLLPHRVGFCGGIFANLDDDGVPEMLLYCREEDHDAENESDSVEQIWTWRNGAVHKSLDRSNPDSTPHGTGYSSLLKGKDRDYYKQGGTFDGETSTYYAIVDKEGSFYVYEDMELPNESKYTEVRLSRGNTVLLANSDYFLYTLACAAAEADVMDPVLALAKMGYDIDPSDLRSETEEYDPAAAAVGKNGEVDWYGILSSLYDNNPAAFADTSTLTSKASINENPGWYTRNGILGADVLDISGDGKDDLVLYTIRHSTDGLAHHDLYMRVYTCKDGKIIGSWEELVNRDEMVPFTGCCYDSMRFGTVNLDSQSYIWTEYIHFSYGANGSTFKAIVFGYDEEDGECYLRPYWLNGKNTQGTNNVLYSLQIYGHGGYDAGSQRDQLLWTDDYSGSSNAPYANVGEAIVAGYQTIGFPDVAVYSSDSTTDTGNTGDQFRDQFPTYWNTSAVKKSLQLADSGTQCSDYINWDMTSKIDDYTGMEDAIKNGDGTYSDYIEHLKKLASGDPEKVISSVETGNKSSSSSGTSGNKSSSSSGTVGNKSSSSGTTGKKTSSSYNVVGKSNTPAVDTDHSTGTNKGTNSLQGSGNNYISADVVPGDTVTFGSYSNSAYGRKSPIEWKVLKIKDGRALLVSKYGVDCLPYNDKWVDTTWKETSLRTWLNNTFLNNAFSSQEKQFIISAKIENRDNRDNPGGDSTMDCVFILDIEELEEYFDSDEDRKIKATEYAQNNGAFMDDDQDACWYWVRNPGDDAKYAAYVNCKGDILKRGMLVFNNTFAVRPAIWVKTN